jgi:acetyl/propionyl-CoA carboxylase alpha subunit/acetyl-CoA carboxylase carboxyltransferase component
VNVTGFDRIAIVNRGEPAVRLINAVAEYNAEFSTSLQTIALYTDADRNALFVREADVRFGLGPASFEDHDGNRKVAYLNYDLLEHALVETAADAAWVGWGFVAEHPEFAALCKRLGVVFIGPDPDVMERLGDKVAAKRLATEAGVPVAPWSLGPVATPEEAARIASDLGYPVMVKATSGGGGRGIRRVESPAALAEAFSQAQAEALGAFGDDTVFLEKALSAARHIEVQIIGDTAGTVWPVGVRDCSMQRRNQKVIEEAPSPVLTRSQDTEIRAAAARLASQAGYVGAGTVEFLYDPSEATFSFMEVNTRLQVEHPVTEATTGLDLVKMQIHVARGGLLEGDSPPTQGHSIEARLNAEDPDRDFMPAAGLIELLRFPAGPGIRVDSGVEENDVIPSEFDSMIAKIIAHGGTREEARGRLLRALRQTKVVVREGATNKGFLQALLAHPDFLAAKYDTDWVDRLVASKRTIGTGAGPALIAAAIDAYHEQLATEIMTFRDSANHGRPEIHPTSGKLVKLRLQGQRYEFDVDRSSPNDYRLVSGDHVVEAAVEHLGRTGNRLSCGGREYRVMSVVHGATHFVEVDGVAHRITHDEGGIVRAPSPAVVVAIDVSAGQRVSPGDRLAVIEAMKMETAISAEFAGIVREVLVQENTQVGPGTPLLVVDPGEERVGGYQGDRVDIGPQALSADDVTHRGCRHYLGALRSMLLGWDVRPAHLDSMIAPGSELCTTGAADPTVRQLEDEALEIFVDVISLFRRTLPADSADGERRTTEEYLFDYMRDLGAHRGALPEQFTDQLLRALLHFDVHSLDKTTPELVEALLRLAKSQARMHTQVPALLTVLEDRLAHAGEPDEQFSGLLDRLIHETQERYPAVHDIALELRYAEFDLPFLEQVRQREYTRVNELLTQLDSHPSDADRDAIVKDLVACPQPLKPTLSATFADASPRLQETLLEIMTRRYYRIRELGPFSSRRIDGFVISTTDYVYEGHPIHLASTHLIYEDLKRGVTALRTALEDIPPEYDLAVEVYVRRSRHPGSPERTLKRITKTLDAGLGELQLRRIVVAVSGPGSDVSMSGVLNFTFRPSGEGRYVEDTQYRDMHPMMGKRLELWRLSNFNHRRLASLSDIYLFHAVAKNNPHDVRLFAQAEVRDITPIRDDHGRVVRVPEFERVFRETLGPIRRYQATLAPRQRLHWNRVVLYVWPTLNFSLEEVEEIVYRMARETKGLGIERVLVRGRIPYGEGSTRERVLVVNNPGGGSLRLELHKPSDSPMQPLSDLAQAIVRLRRRGLIHPSEIIEILQHANGTDRDGNLLGTFVEYDLAGDGALEPISRPYGENTANVVLGVVSNVTDRYPEGMRRVIILGDPSRGMGSLAEPECRRIIAAMDLAESEGIPLEWFAVSAGAQISMDSGTENMDWIGRVLRRIVEFTQHGSELNVIVVGINVGAQPYWNAEATMLMHTKGILVMTPGGAMVLTGKRALDYSGGVSAEDNHGIGGYERIMGPNGQAQYFAADISGACRILLDHYRFTYTAPREPFPRNAITSDPVDRDVRAAVHGGEFATVGDVFSMEKNPDRKLPFEIRQVMAAVTDSDQPTMERWHGMQHAETAIALDAFIGGHSVALLGLESKPMPRLGFVPADGPMHWTSGTLFPVASKKIARAINAASGSRPLVVLANLSGFDGSPESMRRWQLEYGAEIGRAIVNFDGPIVFCVVSRYHGGAFVVFSKTLNESMEVAALEGSRASVIGGAPAAAVVFTPEVRRLTNDDPRIIEIEEKLELSSGSARTELRRQLGELRRTVAAEKQGEVAAKFDLVHSVQRAQEVGSIDVILPVAELRPYLIGAIERGKARFTAASDDRR